jgi:type VI secretion system protein ImpB
MSKADRSENLELLLENILKNKDDLARISGELGLDKGE